MSRLSHSEIKHLAKLSRINLSQEELEEFNRQLPTIVEFVEVLKQAPVSKISHHEPKKLSDLREDNPHNRNLTIEQIERLAPNFSNRLVVVPPIFEDNYEQA